MQDTDIIPYNLASLIFFKYKIKTVRSRLNSLKLNLVGKFFAERNF